MSERRETTWGGDRVAALPAGPQPTRPSPRGRERAKEQVNTRDCFNRQSPKSTRGAVLTQDPQRPGQKPSSLRTLPREEIFLVTGKKIHKIIKGNTKVNENKVKMNINDWYVSNCV